MSEVQPFEAKGLEVAPTAQNISALQDICTAVNGFPYPGHRSEAIVMAVAYLQTRPDLCNVLSLRGGVDA